MKPLNLIITSKKSRVSIITDERSGQLLNNVGNY